MYIDRRSREELPVAKEVQFAFSILNYNQSLVQFADSKANALLLINSIFLAALTPFTEILQKLSGPGFMVFIGFVITCIISILLSMSVITTKRVPLDDDPRTTSLVFYQDVMEMNSPEGYVNEFNTQEARQLRDSLLRNVFVVSTIAQQKFSVYNSAQSMTFLSTLFWIASMLACFILH